ncbi:MAG: lysine--tRNA ligase, partial [bacterium]|nr:lysine--tRNA ligase [bacterium]
MSENETQQPLEQLIANRRAKLDSLREQGVDPFPTRFRVEVAISKVREQYESLSGEELEEKAAALRIAGRVLALRRQGKVVFADLSDGKKHLQLFIRKNNLDESQWALVKELDLGDFIGVEGTLFRTRTGELSVMVSTLTVLAKSLRPLPEK